MQMQSRLLVVLLNSTLCIHTRAPTPFPHTCDGLHVDVCLVVAHVAAQPLHPSRQQRVTQAEVWLRHIDGRARGVTRVAVEPYCHGGGDVHEPADGLEKAVAGLQTSGVLNKGDKQRGRGKRGRVESSCCSGHGGSGVHEPADGLCQAVIGLQASGALSTVKKRGGRVQLSYGHRAGGFHKVVANGLAHTVVGLQASGLLYNGEGEE